MIGDCNTCRVLWNGDKNYQTFLYFIEVQQITIINGHHVSEIIQENVRHQLTDCMPIIQEPNTENHKASAEFFEVAMKSETCTFFFKSSVIPFQRNLKQLP